MADILQNEIKQDEPMSVQEPSLQGYGEQSYVGTAGGKPQASAVSGLVYTNTTATSASNVASADLATLTIPAGTLLAGSLLRVKVGFSDTDWDAAGVVLVSLLIGSTVNITLSNMACSNGAAEAGGWAEFVLYGVTNKNQRGNGQGFLSETGNDSTALHQAYTMPTLVYSSFDMDGTIDQTAILRVTWSSPSATNKITMAYIIAERVV